MRGGAAASWLGSEERLGIMALLTVAEVAERLSVSPSLVYELVQGGKLPHVRFGKPGRRGTIRVSEEDVAEMIASCKSRGGAGAALESSPINQSPGVILGLFPYVTLPLLASSPPSERPPSGRDGSRTC